MRITRLARARTTGVLWRVGLGGVAVVWDTVGVSGMSRPGPGWLFDELSGAGRENLDGAHVARYDTKMDSDARAEVEMLGSWGLGAESTIVDLGAGTGQFALAVAPRCRRVIAVDVSPVMLNALRDRVAAVGLENVEVVEAGFLGYCHAGAPADIVYSRFALHHLPDFWKAVALQRVHDVLRPGGTFRLWDVVFGFEPAQVVDRVEAWCATGGEDVDAEWLREELEDHVRDEHSTFTWLLEPMIEHSGFDIREAWYSDDGFTAKYLLTRR